MDRNVVDRRIALSNLSQLSVQKKCQKNDVETKFFRIFVLYFE